MEWRDAVFSFRFVPYCLIHPYPQLMNRKIPVPLEYDDETETDDVAAELEDAEVKEAS